MGMSESYRVRPLGYDLHDGRWYVHKVSDEWDETDGPTTEFAMLRPAFSESTAHAMPPMAAGEERFMLPVNGGRVIKIKCTAHGEYEFEARELPSEFDLKANKPKGPTRSSAPRPKPVPVAGSDDDDGSTPIAVTHGIRKLSPIDHEGLQDALDDLDALEGLEEAKRTIRQLVSYAKRKRQLRELGDEREKQITLHLAITGNPGTGKSTLVDIYARSLKALGLLSKGHVVKCKEGDLIPGHIGGAAPATEKKCKEALGGLMHVDEAHTMLPGEGMMGEFKRSSWNVMNDFMEENRDNFVMVISGYDDRPGMPGITTLMQRMSGTFSRFRTKIHNEDPKPSQLESIFVALADEAGLYLSEDAQQAAFSAIRQRKRELGNRFENAREVRNILDTAITRVAERTCPADGDSSDFSQLSPAARTAELIRLKTVLPEDFKSYQLPALDQPALDRALAELDALIGQDEVKKAIRDKVDLALDWRQQVELHEADKLDMPENHASFHLILTGPMGTGKTEIARIYGQILRAAGWLRSGHLIEAHNDDMVAGFVDQTANRANEKINEALNGVLLLDEAPDLTPRGDGSQMDFKREALGVLSKRMEDDRHRLVVVMTGNREGMEGLFKAEPRLISRSKTFIEHKAYDDAELVGIFNKLVNDQGFILAPGAQEAAEQVIAQRRASAGDKYGNGRDVRNMIELADEKKSARLSAQAKADGLVRKSAAEMTPEQRKAKREEHKLLTAADFNALAAGTHLAPKAPERRGIGFMAEHSPANQSAPRAA
jgi:SpoVK/Ycf46/Vps4 family AAA+-type ATPase